jgi:hypothetical protein
VDIKEKRKKHAEYMRKYYRLYKDRVDAANKKWKHKNKDILNERHREYYKKNPNKFKMYYKKNGWKYKGKKHEWYEKHVVSRPEQKPIIIGRSGSRKKIYRLIYKPDHPFCTRAGYVFEHRLIMEQKIGRYLAQNEIVHHINENGLDNSPDNLVLITKGKHSQLHMPERDRLGRFVNRL